MKKVYGEFKYDIAILRLFSIIVVVFFHAYGMTYASHLPEAIAEMYRDKYELFNQSYPINIAMPMFVVISGYLFGSQLYRNKFLSFGQMAWNKFKRVMIPFFVFTILFMFTTNSISWEPFYRWSYWHLWFLPMLFWCFIAGFLLKNVIGGGKAGMYLLPFLFALSLADKFIPMVLGLHNITKWFCWFVMGMMVYLHEEKIFSTIRKYHLIYGLIIIYILTGVLYNTEYGDVTVPGIIASVSAVMGIWYLCRLISWGKYETTNYVLALSACSFGIYIFHNWIEMYMVSRTAQRVLPIADWAGNHIYLFPFMFSLIAFCISFGITWILRKTQVGRFLVG